MRIFLLCCCFFPLLLTAQKVMQLEKYGKVKAQKFFIGDEITYQLVDDDYWRTAAITDINPENNYILLDERLVSINKIIGLKSFKNQGWSKGIGQQLNRFALGWIVFGLADKFIFDGAREASWGLILIPAGTGLISGWLLPRIFKERILKIGKKRKLRLLDLNPLPYQSIP